MADYRQCDGPGCEVRCDLNRDTSSFAEVRVEDFIEINIREIGVKHFHSQTCLVKWAKTIESEEEPAVADE